MKKTVISIILLAAVVLGAYVLYNSLSDKYAPDITGGEVTEHGGQDQKTAAPDFVVYDEAENAVRLSDFEGKPVVVNFWASWCPPCKEEMGDFEKIYRKYGDKVEVMMINTTDGMQETKERAKAHIEEEGYTFPVYYDTDLSASVAYGVTSIPVTYFVDTDGNLFTYVRGMTNYETLEEIIDLVQKDKK